MKINDEQLLSICLSEIKDAAGGIHGDLSAEREDALDRYLGEPYGDEIKGRSQFRSREVYEAVEGILPSLCRIFCEEDNMVLFEPTGEEDEPQAEQESDVCNYIYWQQNRGFYNTYTFLKDALLSKNGVLKFWIDKSEDEEREEYENLDDVQLGQLLSEEGVEREVLEYELTESGHHVIFKTTKKRTKVCIEPVPPEEFGVSSSARSPYVEDANFVWQRCLKSYSDLIAEGYDKEFLETLPADDDTGTPERIARRHLSDEDDWLRGSRDEISMREFWITECYLRIDRDDDGISELLRVTIATSTTSGGGGEVMDVEEVDYIPFVSASPVLLTHKFYGLSIADLVSDIQEIQTSLNRQILDNTYLANNGQTAVNTDYVNFEDMLTKRPGGIVRFEGDVPWSNVLGPIPHNQLPAQTFELLNRLDERIKSRVGSADDVAGLDANSLSNVNTGVAALAFDMARMKIEQIARIIAEVAFKPLFHGIHELMLKHQDVPMTVRLRGQWTPVNPGEWRTRENSTVQVGIGNVSRERRIMGYEAVMAKQQALAASGAMGMLLNPEHIYEAHKGWVKAWGFEPDLYFQDPRKVPPPQPQEPGAQDQVLMAQAKALIMEQENKADSNKIQAAKLKIERENAQRNDQYREVEILLKTQIEGLKNQLNTAKAKVDITGKIANISAQKDKEDVESKLKVAEMRLDEINAEKDRQLDLYKAQMDHYAKLLQINNLDHDPARIAEREAEEAERATMESSEKEQAQRQHGELHASIIQMTEKLSEIESKTSRPKEVKRDKDGFIISIGGVDVQRDESGKVTQIG
jgi:hypothetical protein